MLWLHRVMNGYPLPDDLDRLSRGFSQWLATASTGGKGPSLACCLGLPDGSMRARTLMRDHYLREAAGLLGCDRVATSARLLCDAVIDFHGREWLEWRGGRMPPPNAGEMPRLLFFATWYGGGRLPESPRQYINILKS